MNEGKGFENNKLERVVYKSAGYRSHVDEAQKNIDYEEKKSYERLAAGENVVN